MRWIPLTLIAAAVAGTAASVVPTGLAAMDPEPAMAVPAHYPEPVTGGCGERIWTPQDAARLGRGGDALDTAELWQLALTNRDPMVAGNAVRSLGRRGEIGGARLGALLRDSRLRVRQEAVFALGRSRDPAVVDQLAQLLATGEPHLRLLAIGALGELGGDRAHALVAAQLAAPGATATEVAFARQALQSIATAGGAAARSRHGG